MWSAPVAFRRVDCDEGFEPPPAVCQRWQDQRHPTAPSGRLLFAPAQSKIAIFYLALPPPFPPPLGLSSGAFWSSQCSAGASLRDAPVVIPLLWRVVADWLLSSLLLMATKASALGETLPSTPCCGCFSFFCGRRPLPFGGSHLRLPSGPAGIRTTTGRLSALAKPTPYQLSHRVAYVVGVVQVPLALH